MIDDNMANFCLLTHSLVKNKLNNETFSVAYQQISLQTYPLYESAHRRKVKRINPDILAKLSYLLYQANHQNYIAATCLSISVTLQTLLFSTGNNVDLIIGVRKVDGQLLAHSWIQINPQWIIDSQREWQNSEVLEKRSMLKEVYRWGQEICDSG